MASRAPSTTRLARVAFIGLAILAGSASASSLYGRVVTTTGEPAANLTMHLQQVRFAQSGMSTASSGPAVTARTDPGGRFTFQDVPAGVLGLMSIMDLPLRETTHWYRSIDFGGVAVYGQQQLLFSVAPNTVLDDVTITVLKRSRISGQVRYADGTPLSGARLGVKHEYRSDSGSGNGGSSLRTDTLGRYTFMLDEVAVHSLAITYEGLAASSGDFVVNRPGEDIDGVDLVLTDAATVRDPEEWIENPATGHEYRTVDAGGWFECRRAAIELGARLVTITDAAEQEWLLDMFGGRDPYWIGLVDEQGEGAWTWMSAESTEYSNWGKGWPLTAEGRRRYAHMNWIDTPQTRGLWRDVGPDGSDWLLVRKAIIERDPTPAE